MTEYRISPIFAHDEPTLNRYHELCRASGLFCETCMDLLVGLFDAHHTLLAAGGVKGNIIRGLVSDEAQRGQGLMAQIVSELLAYQASRGIFRNFLYGKKQYEPVYRDLGFYSLAEAANTMVFMENSRSAFSDFLQVIKEDTRLTLEERGLYHLVEGPSAGIVMNANPFTRGHLSLVEWAASQCPVVHLFVLEEEASDFSFTERWSMVTEGVAHLPQVVLHKSSSYIISQASFPSYFLKTLDEGAVLQAEIDAKIFIQIAHALGICDRFLGSEPTSDLTRAYNRILQSVLTEAGISVHIMERSANDHGVVFSGTLVRELLNQGRIEEALALVPITSQRFLMDKYIKK